MDELSLKGWIKLYRKVMDSKLWFVEPFSKAQAWIDLLLLANHSDNSYSARGILITVKRGQLAYSQKTLASRWKWSRKKVANFLKYLEMEHQIEHQNTNLTTIITIVNYEEYQQGEHQTEHQRNTKRTPEEHQKNTNNNDKNEEKEKNEKKNTLSPDELALMKKFAEEITAQIYGAMRSKPEYNTKANRDQCVKNLMDSIKRGWLDSKRVSALVNYYCSYVGDLEFPYNPPNIFGRKKQWQNIEEYMQGGIIPGRDKSGGNCSQAGGLFPEPDWKTRKEGSLS